MDKHLKALKDATLADDYVFGQVMGQEKIAKNFLEILLNCKIKQITRISKQAEFKDSLASHSIRLDVYLNDENGTHYNVEMQTTNKDNLERRIRYYQGMIDRDTLEKGIPYSETLDSYIIFICSFDYYNRGAPVYEKECKIKGYPDLEYKDGTHVFILNSEYKNNSTNSPRPLLEFLSYIHDEKSPFQSDFVKDVSMAVNNVRSDQAKGVEYMTLQQKIYDERLEAHEEGRKEGIKEGIKEGEKRLELLLQKMMEDRLDSDIPRVIQDKKFKQEMFEKYNLQ